MEGLLVGFCGASTKVVTGLPACLEVWNACKGLTFGQAGLFSEDFHKARVYGRITEQFSKSQSMGTTKSKVSVLRKYVASSQSQDGPLGLKGPFIYHCLGPHMECESPAACPDVHHRPASVPRFPVDETMTMVWSLG